MRRSCEKIGEPSGVEEPDKDAKLKEEVLHFVEMSRVKPEECEQELAKLTYEDPDKAAKVKELLENKQAGEEE